VGEGEFLVPEKNIKESFLKFSFERERELYSR